MTTAAPRCFARTCGTCWVCTAAAEQVRAVADRRWAADWTPTLVLTSPPCWLTPQGRIVDAPADVQARAAGERALDELCEATDEDERQMAAALAVVLGGLFA